jgi:DNA-binding XRE family transcriptional regulator
VNILDCDKVGKLIFGLRKEKGLTQKQLADTMNISDRTISKWERGMGCPDVSLLHELSKVLGVNIEKILIGDLGSNSADGGNMKRIKFYNCPTCNNVLTATGEAEVSCCGRKLAALIPKPSNQEHYLNVENIENDYYITFPHEMSKEHYLNFVALISVDRILFVRLYPEQGTDVRLPRHHGGKLFFGCSKHGLWVND